MRILALTLYGLFGMVASVAAAEEATWREPGQIVDADYLKHGKLRYTAEDREIVGHNRTCFNNRPLVLPAADRRRGAGWRSALRAADRPGLCFRRVLRSRFSAAGPASGFTTTPKSNPGIAAAACSGESPIPACRA